MDDERIDETQVEAILSAGRAQVDRYVVTTLAVLVERTARIEREIDERIRIHQEACRGQSRKTLYGFIAAVGTCLGLATPYLLRLIGQ